LDVVFNPDNTDVSRQFEEIVAAKEIIDELKKADGKSQYQVEKLLQALEEPSAQAA
jgi:hypothetical protein